MQGEPVELTAVEDVSRAMVPYERLIGDALAGHSELFTRQDAVELAWRIFDPVLDLTDRPLSYEPGSWGPERAREAFAPSGGWIDPVA